MTRKQAPVATDEDYDRDLLVFDDAAEYSSSAGQDVQSKVKEAQEELLKLRQRQEEIERHQQQLELIKLKQGRFANGKREVLEKLNRAMSGLESELYSSQKLIEELSATLESFERHAEILRGLQPEHWQRSDIDHELDEAIAAIDEANTEFAKGSRRLSALRPVASESPTSSRAPAATSGFSLAADDDWQTWAQRGLAFNAALIVSVLACIIACKFIF
jgi:chromosome segregation ATPase